jgi:hypothetical protein
MPQEMNVTITFSATKPPTLGTNGNGIGRTWNAQLDIAGKYFVANLQTFTTTPTALNIGGITNVGFVAIRHTGATGILLVRNGSGGTDLVKCRPGGTPGQGGDYLLRKRN